MNIKKISRSRKKRKKRKSFLDKLKQNRKKKSGIEFWRFGVVVSIPLLLLIFLGVSSFKIQVLSGKIHINIVSSLSFTKK
ncbi:MAG: hypothetical protein PF689_13580, partial [Deltaproteobacteria bacterium]|nr:hypothetical protein [Deltaproteobacteria bacterium]